MQHNDIHEHSNQSEQYKFTTMQISSNHDVQKQARDLQPQPISSHVVSTYKHFPVEMFMSLNSRC